MTHVKRQLIASLENSVRRPGTLEFTEESARAVYVDQVLDYEGLRGGGSRRRRSAESFAIACGSLSSAGYLTHHTRIPSCSSAPRLGIGCVRTRTREAGRHCGRIDERLVHKAARAPTERRVRTRCAIGKVDINAPGKPRFGRSVTRG